MGRTAKYHHTLKRHCSSCGNPIIDANKSGYCTSCHRYHRGLSNPIIKTRNGSAGHKQLIIKAVNYLQKKGYKDIHTEYKRKIDGQNYIIDAVAILHDELIAIECGDLYMRKAITLAPAIKQLFYWPYKSKHPYKISVSKNLISIVIAK